MKGREKWSFLRRWWSFQWFKLVRIGKKVVRSESTAHSIALGNSVGFFVGLQPCVGSQTVVGLLLATLLRANRLATLVPCWITNPATVVPVYAFNYWVGYLITGWGPNQEEFKEALVNSERILSEEGVFSGVVEAFHELMRFGPWAFFSLLIGSLIVGLIVAALVYPPTLFLVKRVRQMRDLRRQQRHERVKKHLFSMFRHHSEVSEGAGDSSGESGKPPSAQ